MTKEEALQRMTPRQYRRYVGSPAKYERRQVEALLTAMWNGDAVVDDLQPDQGMPRAKANPSHMGNGLVAMIDIRRAWIATQLAQQEREALVLHYERGYTQALIGESISVSRQTAGERIDSGVSAVLRYLNGE